MLLAGPTGVGKSAVALELAERLEAEIVSADARQVYRGLDIGTAKPTPAERARVPHHLLDLIDPPDRYSAARFVAEAEGAIHSIHERGRQALVVGGSGLYFKALREGLFDSPETTPEVRARVEEMLKAGGRAGLVSYLEQQDPTTLAQLDAANPARLRRAVEFHLMTGESLALRRAAQGPHRSFQYYPVVLVRPRVELYARLEQRLEAMLTAGWELEVRNLAQVWDPALPGFDAVGYREMYAFVQEEISLAEARRLINQRTRQYAKRQLTWFTHQGDWLWMSPGSDVTLKIASGLLRFAENKSA